MRIAIDVTMTYRFPNPNTVFLAIEAAHTDGQAIVGEDLQLGYSTATRITGDSGVGERLWVRVPGDEMQVRYRSTVDITRPDIPLNGLKAQPVWDLPSDVVPYLRPSRYCQSDKFTNYVAQHFGHIDGGAKVAAIRDWIEQELSYVPGASDSDTNVLETFVSRQGVCRDSAHLLCSLVRAAGIPARAVAAYGPDVNPSDFHAVVQVWLDGAWHLVDATGMGRPDTLVVVAVGRDAYDIAFMESEAPAELIEQTVVVSRS